MHSAFMADGTDIDQSCREAFVPGFPVKYLGIRVRQWGIQEHPAKAESIAARTVGEETEVADLSKALRENVDEESSDELVCIESHRSNAVMLFAISPLKRDLSVLKCNQAVIGNGNPVCVAAEIIENLSGSAKGRFGIDDPFVCTVSA